MKVGYVRISTKEQNTARQDLLMQELGVERVFTDKISGKNQERPELRKMMDFVREGDRVFCALAELERDNILERQAEGIAIAKAEGRMTVRPKKAVDINMKHLEASFEDVSAAG